MDTLYRKLDLIEQLNLSVGTIDNHMKKGSLKYLKIGKAVRFRDEDVDTWIRQHYPIKHLSKNGRHLVSESHPINPKVIKKLEPSFNKELKRIMPKGTHTINIGKKK